MIKLNVVDNNGLYHDKQVYTDGSASSDNGWIYTAYAKKLGMFVKSPPYSLYLECLFLKSDNSIGINRLPRMKNPPISRDEILGLAYLECLGIRDSVLEDMHFCPFHVPKFNLFKFISQLGQMIPSFNKKHYDDAPLGKYLWRRHRCFFWEHGLDQMYKVAFTIPLTDRNFLLVEAGKFDKFKLSHQFYRLVAKLDSLLPVEDGIRWLKYGKSLSGMRKEFPIGHPFLEDAILGVKS